MSVQLFGLSIGLFGLAAPGGYAPTVTFIGAFVAVVGLVLHILRV